MTEPRKDFDTSDGVISGILKTVEPPSDLRRRLMTLEPLPKRPAYGVWLVAVASLAMILLVISFEKRGPSLDKAEADLAAFLSTDFALSVSGKSLPDLRQWLGAKSAPSGEGLPANLAALVPEGCRVIDWDGHRASLICFEAPGGMVLHLVIFEGGTFQKISGSPRIAQRGSWSVASWSSGSSQFLLFGEMDSEILRGLL